MAADECLRADDQFKKRFFVFATHEIEIVLEAGFSIKKIREALHQQLEGGVDIFGPGLAFPNGRNRSVHTIDTFLDDNGELLHRPLLGQQIAGYHKALDLRCSLTDLKEPLIPVETLDGIFFHEAVAAVNLYGFIGDFFGDLRAV